jgi:predicted kinase
MSTHVRISNPRTLIALSGVPGSGKSTLIKRIVKSHPGTRIVVVNPDAIRKQLTGDMSNHSRDPEVWRSAHQQVRDASEKGQPVIFDATLANPRTRKEIAALVPEDYERVLVRMGTSLEESLNRNLLRDRKVPEEVIRRMWRNLKENPPKMSEGWTQIVRV